MRYLFNILIIILAVTSLSCGVYGFRGSNPPEGIKSLAIPQFQDNSGFSEAGMKENFTEILKTMVISDNTFIIADKNVADGVLNCTIMSVKDEALVISGNENVTKRKITITVNVDFENLKKQKKVWEKKYENWGEYNSSAVSFSDRAVGITTAETRICDDILIDITSNW